MDWNIPSGVVVPNVAAIMASIAKDTATSALKKMGSSALILPEEMKAPAAADTDAKVYS